MQNEWQTKRHFLLEFNKKKDPEEYIFIDCFFTSRHIDNSRKNFSFFLNLLIIYEKEKAY